MRVWDVYQVREPYREALGVGIYPPSVEVEKLLLSGAEVLEEAIAFANSLEGVVRIREREKT